MLKDTFIETIKEYKMLEPKDLVVVAVSGGADSTALLHLLDACKEQLGISLHIAHLNHNIRKGESDLDVRYVQGLAQRLKLPITVELFDVPSYAEKEKIGLEEAARDVRYSFFERLSRQIGANKIAVGHNADDNVETFLMRILRGSGIKGLCGIPPKRGKIIRPMIKIWRREIEDYVGSLKLVPRRDHTNYESRFTRNRVRLKLIPQLKIYNLNIKEIILQTILLLTEDSNYLETRAEEALERAIIEEGEGEIKLDTEKIRRVDEPIQGHLLRKAIERVKGDLQELTFRHVRDMLAKLDASEKWELHLPGGIFASGGRRELLISREKRVPADQKSFNYVVPVPGEVHIKEINRKLRTTPVEEMRTDHNAQTAYIDAALLGKNLVVRNRVEGDRFVPFGMRGSKKLQDFFVDEKVPAEMRDYIPVVESGSRLVWVGGYRLDDRFKVTRNTKKIIRLELL
jgi:tRNA(Ile)-lysidine synthase